MRDLTFTQYQKAIHDAGFDGPGFMGYCKNRESKISISVANAGPKATRRQRLAYLIEEHDRAVAREEQRLGHSA